jgi:hypothetical protein
MEKRILGILLTVFGAAGLIMAGYNFMNGSGGTYNAKAVAIYGILGLIFFISGISLIRNTRDKPT